ncbi:N-acetylneuraminate synthase [Halopelagius inordinatus]|uniref:N-acetylneuraminate synthase n=1 Tax=Halopelagius inordinatus TaxID=553467 RepID=A0A1I2PUM6_9EURY|nr:N-acetylneuraminate synthase [Halopelagius inordinatus]SFG17316.1 N-acetylneuraminate synthase [Halopelagius inordinatus]
MSTTPPTDSEYCEIIAEAGINHNGELALAKKLVDEAVEAGADVVKFQTFDPNEVVTEATEKAEYQKRSGSGGQYEMLSSVVLDREDHETLVEYCEERCIEFMSTPYDSDSVSILESLGVERYKIASADIVNKPLLEAVAETGKPIILSTGMATLGEIERAVDFLREEGCDDLTLLHCVSCYPAEPEQVNMRFIETLRSAFGAPVGFSDHTLGTDISVMAASRGASTVEKHFTLDREMDGPDHFASLEPDQLTELVEGVRAVTSAMGGTARELSAEERENIGSMRRSLHFRRSMEKGEQLDIEDVKVVRPFEGVDPWEIDDVVNRTLVHDIDTNDPVTWDDLE